MGGMRLGTLASVAMNTRSNLILFVLTVVFVTALNLFPVSAEASGCRAVEALTEGLTASTSKSARVFRETVEYTQIDSGDVYSLTKDLKPYENDLLMYFDHTGHVALIYKGHLIEGEGTPLVRVRLLRGRVENLTRGLVFAFGNLPPEFEERLTQYLANFPRIVGPTCSHVVCQALDRLELGDLTPGKKLGLTPLARHLLTLPPAQKMALGLRVLTLGQSLEKALSILRERERSSVTDIPMILWHYSHATGIILKLVFQLAFRR